MSITLILLLFSSATSAVLLVRTLYMISFTQVLSYQVRTNTSIEKVSVLLPARNEASRVLRENVTSLVAQTYHAMEIIAVDDRSTDTTPKILQELASGDSGRVTFIHGEEPPSGWMGKTYALEQAKRKARGTWLISVDADVIYSSGIVNAALTFVKEQQLDALSMLPRVQMKTFWEVVVIPVMSWLSLMRVSTTQANRRSSKACFGYGNFILFKRSAHDAIGGFESYKGNILDDCAIMEMMKANGKNVMVVDGSKLMYSRMYSSLQEIISGFAKNTFAALRFSVLRTCSVIISELLVVGFPLFYILINVTNNGIHINLPIIIASVAIILFFLTMLSFGVKIRANPVHFILYPIGHAVCICIIAYSMIAYLCNIRVQWKGRSAHICE